MDAIVNKRYLHVIDEIAQFDWANLTEQDMACAAWAYYYFSIQFRESLVAARALHPDDEKLKHLEAEECNTDNLSPWPDVAEDGEKMNHDEFMRRTLSLVPIAADRAEYFRSAGEAYLAMTREMD